VRAEVHKIIGPGQSRRRLRADAHRRPHQPGAFPEDRGELQSTH
jgi:hypothetical protein